MRAFIVAVWSYPGNTCLKDSGIMKKGACGNSLKFHRAHAKEVPAKFGSYDAAWAALKELREFFGVENGQD